VSSGVYDWYCDKDGCASYMRVRGGGLPHGWGSISLAEGALDLEFHFCRNHFAAVAAFVFRSVPEDEVPVSDDPASSRPSAQDGDETSEDCGDGDDGDGPAMQWSIEFGITQDIPLLSSLAELASEDTRRRPS